MDSIKNELFSTGKSETFSARSIVDEIQLIKFFAEMITGGFESAQLEE